MAPWWFYVGVGPAVFIVAACLDELMRRMT